MPQANESLLDRFEGVNRCGVGVIRLMRVLAALLTVIICLGGIVGGILLLVSGSKALGVTALVFGPLGGLTLFLLMTIGIVQYENISLIARNTESQNFIGTAQLELLCRLARSQNENIELTRQTIELVRALDENVYDQAKNSERQAELLEHLEESQRMCRQNLIEITEIGKQLSAAASDHELSTKTWRSDAGELAHAIVRSVSQLPERLRSVLAGGGESPTAQPCTDEGETPDNGGENPSGNESE